MEPIVKAALVGTARSSEPARTGAPTDELVQQASVEGAEKGLLLAAGAWSVWRLAGRKPDLLPELPDLAPEETRPVCSPRAAEVLAQVIDGPYRMLLPEAGRLLAGAGRILPPALLPSALSLPKPYRAELRSALGERGAWLARMEPAWGWVMSDDTGDEAPEEIPAEADRLWEEGSHEQRVALLRRVRRVDPGRARDWLASGFAKEKADRRAALLEAFAVGLGPDDEPFLEKALDDRSQQVRAAAAPLLARLPGSAYAARLRERADTMLSWEQPTQPSGFLGKVGALLGGGGGKAKLLVEPPQEVDAKSWERDGIPATPPQGVGKRAFWLTHILARVPPAHWERRFGKMPAELVAAARETDWQGALLEGWARAALDVGDADAARWMAPLWDAGREIRKDFGPGALPELRPLRPEILAAMPAAEQEERIQILLGEPTAEEGPLDLYLRRLSQPWKPAFANRYLQELRAAATDAVRGVGVAGGTASAWLSTIPLAAVALPVESFDAALAPWPSFQEIEKPDWYQRSWIDKLQELEDVLHLRRTLRKEIVP